MRKVKVLITGGAGFIGSHIHKLLHQKGYETVIFDDFRRKEVRTLPYGTLVVGDLEQDLNKVFSNHKIDAVIHLAASIQVAESMQHPLAYYKNNVCSTVALLNEMRKADVNLFVFSSSAAIFGLPQTPLIAENHPKNPISPYGRSKLMIEEVLEDCEQAYGLRSSALRYFNAAGGDPEGEIKNHNLVEQNVIPILLRSLNGGSFTLFGADYPTHDGTCVRDYIHVWDLAKAHLLALESLLNGSPSSRYNLGNGEGYSLQQVVAMVEKVTGKNVALERGPRRVGDPPQLVANSGLAKKELGWQSKHTLQTIVEDAWKAIIKP